MNKFNASIRRSLGALLFLAGLIGPHAPVLPQNMGIGGNDLANSSVSARPGETNINIAKAFIKARQADDRAALGELLLPDVIWHQPGDNRFSGTHRGIADVLAMLDAMKEASDGTYGITVANRFASNRDWVGIRTEFQARRGDVRMLQVGFDLVRIQGGKIVEVLLFSGDQDEEDRFWGK